MTAHHAKNPPFSFPGRIIRSISFLLCFFLLAEQPGFCQIPGIPLSAYPAMPSRPEISRPVHLRYLAYFPEKEKFTLLLDKGGPEQISSAALKSSSRNIWEYFLTGISLPNDTYWVNLNIGERDRIIDADLARTGAGKIFLDSDLQLKKDAALCLSPDTAEGRVYWDRLYSKAEELYGRDIPAVPAVNKVWVVPDQIIIRETPNSAYIYKATLKILSEKDYRRDRQDLRSGDPRREELNRYNAQLIREMVVPKLTRAVNLSARYAPLRQVYYSFILAQWFKREFKGEHSGLYPGMIDSRNLAGLELRSAGRVNDYFERYSRSAEKGEYCKQARVARASGEFLRTYFSGGIDFDVAAGKPAAAEHLVVIKGSPAVQVVVNPGLEEAEIEKGRPVVFKEDSEPNGQRDNYFSKLEEKSSGTYIAAWKDILDNSGASLRREELDAILNLAKQVLSCNALSPALLKISLKPAAVVNREMVELSIRTARILEEQLRRPDLPEENRERSIYSFNEIMDIGQYSLEYSSALNFVNTTKVMASYFLDRNHPGEKLGVMPGLRLLWGMHYGVERSDREFLLQFDKMVSLGNKIEPDLYSHPDELRSEMSGFLRSLYDEKDQIKLKVEREFGGNREMYSRFIPLMFAFLPVVYFGLALLGLPVFPVTLPGAIITILTGVGASIFISWYFLLRGMGDDFYNSKTKEIGDLKKSFLEIPQSGGKRLTGLSGSEMLQQEYRLILKALDEELGTDRPSADIVLVSTGADQERYKLLDSLFKGGIRPLVRPDVPVVLIPSQGPGSGAAFLDMFGYLRSPDFAAIKSAYPGLKDKEVSEIRVVGIFAGKPGINNAALPFNPVRKIGRRLGLIDLALLNGYKAARELKEQGRGGVVFMFADGLFVSPMKRKGEITLLGSWMGQRQIVQQQFGLILSDIGGSDRIGKLYEKMDFKTVKNKLERKSLVWSYDWDNHEKRQMLGFSGGLIVSFEDPSRYSQFCDLLQGAQGIIYRAGLKHVLNLSHDILVPLIMQSNGENIYTYLSAVRESENARSPGRGTDKPKEREFYFNLFDYYSAKKSSFDFRAYAPYHRQSFYLRMDNSRFQKERLARLAEIINSIPEDIPARQPVQITLQTGSNDPARISPEQRRRMILDFFNEPRNRQQELVVKEVQSRLFFEKFGKENSPYYAAVAGDLDLLAREGKLTVELKALGGERRFNYYRLASPSAGKDDPASPGSGKTQPVGGIDLRDLVPSPGSIRGPGLDPSQAPQLLRLALPGGDPEFSRIQDMIRADVIPSAESLRDYLRSLISGKPGSRDDIYKLQVCITGILRLEEEKAAATDPALIDVLADFESAVSVSVLRSELPGIRLQHIPSR